MGVGRNISEPLAFIFRAGFKDDFMRLFPYNSLGDTVGP